MSRKASIPDERNRSGGEQYPDGHPEVAHENGIGQRETLRATCRITAPSAHGKDSKQSERALFASPEIAAKLTQDQQTHHRCPLSADVNGLLERGRQRVAVDGNRRPE